jgi:hypothetical protein
MQQSMPSRSCDTTPEAERELVARIRTEPVARRLHRAVGLSATVIGAARRALARARPHASKRELDLWFVELHYGREVADGLREDLERRDREHASGS